MPDIISRRGLFSLGLAASVAVVAGQPALARGGRDPADRQELADKKARRKAQRKAWRDRRRLIEAERRKSKP